MSTELGEGHVSFFDGLIQETKGDLNMASDRMRCSSELRILGALYATQVCLAPLRVKMSETVSGIEFTEQGEQGFSG